MARRSWLACALAFVLVAAAACSRPSDESATPGVTDTTVTIGSHQPLSHPLAPAWGQLPLAAKAYFDHVNANGGVHGRKIIFTYRDDGGEPDNSIKVVQNLVEKDKVFAILAGWGADSHAAVIDYLNSRKVPDLIPNGGSARFNNPVKLPYTFGWYSSLREGKILGDYISKAFPGKKVAYFYQRDEVGESGIKGLDKVIPPSSVVARESYLLGETDVTAQMRAIHRAKADVIVSFSLTNYNVLLRLAQKKLGNTARLVLVSTGSDPTTLSGLLTSATGDPATGSSMIQGIITNAWLVPVSDTSNSWIVLVKMIHDRYLSGRPLDRYTEMGVAAAYLFVEALQRTGRNLTRQSLVDTLEKGGLSPGLGLTPLDYSRTSHAGYAGAQIGVIKGNAIVLQGKPMITDDGAGPVVPYTAPLPRPPASGIPPPPPQG
ncbi:ABC transporter substrate-binding protein [Streptomyces sp. NBC_01017]|uniref:ABC transporter substrate-binding protein n=1 Tax=Streptomyces sp. NBC_01017 TaxID=2903721 RepID=UPI00386B210F|nr:ABC transporter substrate-binding protein [Streptomyces sp. NBC_01017]WSV34892.1 ABC transporter substrate-binding protein [Streptomyces sp. NBC_01017]